MNIYCFSGLGTDERVFKNLKTRHNLIYLPWIKPQPMEKMEQYALRMCEKIDTTTPFALLGVSFGGMVASTVAKYLKPVKTIIISSSACVQELPVKIKVARILPVSIIPTKYFIPPFWIVSRFFGVRKGFFYELLKQIINDSDPYLVKWSVYQIMTWKQKTIPKNLIRIHGDKDILLPKKRGIYYDYTLPGGHFMVVEKHRELSNIIDQVV